MSQKILVVDDEQAIIDLLEYNLRQTGYRVVVARDGHAALRLARTERPDLIILDLMLPGPDGFDVADDYVTKPFSVRELMARVKAVLRRVEPAGSGDSAVCRVGPLEMDSLAREARFEGAPLPLTRLEFDLLEMLARHAGQALSREQLLDQVWGYDYYGDARAVDSAVKRLRAKLREAGHGPDSISTVRGVGYRLEKPQ
jgi:DNA-binding response OmpR family regulator